MYSEVLQIMMSITNADIKYTQMAVMLSYFKLSKTVISTEALMLMYNCHMQQQRVLAYNSPEQFQTLRTPQYQACNILSVIHKLQHSNRVKDWYSEQSPQNKLVGNWISTYCQWHRVTSG